MTPMTTAADERRLLRGLQRRQSSAEISRSFRNFVNSHLISNKAGKIPEKYRDVESNEGRIPMKVCNVHKAFNVEILRQLQILIFY